ncbi:MAG: hypothetical protein ABJH28_10280 [Paraglaciecola sp.]|uniref:hypothetical protein n=1 Tax=Paraglaciecola sp. TaxID=1920173 RepID=UPI003267C266
MRDQGDRLFGYRNIRQETKFLVRCASNFTSEDPTHNSVAPNILCAYITKHIKYVDLPPLSEKFNAQQQKRVRMLFKQAVSFNEEYTSQSADKILNAGASKIIDAQGCAGLSTLLKQRFKKRGLISSFQALEL